MILSWMFLCFVSTSATTEVIFSGESLGIGLSPDDAEVDLGNAVFNTLVESVKSAAATKQGLQKGDVVIRVAGWSADGASVDEVIEEIRKHKKRPLKITFATPEPEDEEDEDDAMEDDDDAMEDDGDDEEYVPKLDPEAVAEAMRKAKKEAGFDDNEDNDEAEEADEQGVNSVIAGIEKRHAEARRKAMEDPDYQKFEEESNRAWREMVNKRRVEEGLPPIEEKKKRDYSDNRPVCTEEDLKPSYDFRLGVKFQNESLGFTLAQEEVDAYKDGEWFHAKVEKVDDHLEMEGIQPGAVIHSVGKWPARDKSVDEVFEHIRATKKRPLTVKFLLSSSPNHCRHPDTLKKEDESEEAQEAGQESEERDDTKEPTQTCTIDPATGTCAKEETPTGESVAAQHEDNLPGVVKITFEDMALGIRVNTKDANYNTGGAIYNAQVRKVLSRRISKRGLQDKDLILRVDNWSTKGASAQEVIDYIQNDSERPMTIYFLKNGAEIPRGEDDEPNDADDSAAEDAGDSAAEDAGDSAAEDAGDSAAEDAKQTFDTKVVTFKKKGLGIRLEKANSQTYIDDAVFNARVSKVVNKRLAEDGVKAGDVLVQVGGWPAKGASITDVVAQIKKHKDRPLQITFATPDQEQDEDEFIF